MPKPAVARKGAGIARLFTLGASSARAAAQAFGEGARHFDIARRRWPTPLRRATCATACACW